MVLPLFALIVLLQNPLLQEHNFCFLKNNMSCEKDRKRTEMEWICSRCRLPAEGSYCTRCGQIYEKPVK